MKGKVCLITGSTSGIGEAAAMNLAARGATVVVVGRDRTRCEAACARIRAVADGGSVDFLVADLSSRSDIQRLADDFQRKHTRLDVLLNNASAIFLRRRETVDGIEATFALNHLAYFFLTNLLIDCLKASAPARIVNVASAGHSLVKELDFDDLQGRRSYRGFKAYHQSKLANLMFTYELARRLEGTRVTVNALDPGMVATNIGRNNGLLWRVMKPIGDRLFGFKYVSAAEGARTAVYLSCSPEVEGITGTYFVDGRAAESSVASRDHVAWRRLWDVCESMTATVR